MEAPLITIFVRHAADCKYVGDEFCKRCNCRKHLRWSRNGKQYRRAANVRTWAEAEKVKRGLEDQLTGRKPATDAARAGMLIEDAVDVFMQAKRNDGLEAPSLQKLQKTCDRINEFSRTSGVFLLEDISLVHLTTWNWGLYFNTIHSIRTNQERVKTFFRYFHNAGVIAKNPAVAWQRIKGKTPQVSGFTAAEFDRILAAIPSVERKQAYRDRERTQKAAQDLQQKLRPLSWSCAMPALPS